MISRQSFYQRNVMSNALVPYCFCDDEFRDDGKLVREYPSRATWSLGVFQRLEIGDQVGEVLGAQSLGQAVGHERDVAALSLVDVGLGDPDRLCVGVLDLDGRRRSRCGRSR